jgi:ABC-type hemin transport system substrate-binding protein
MHCPIALSDRTIYPETNLLGRPTISKTSSEIHTDDLGHPLSNAPLDRPAATRIVSLVPSLTEAIAATRREALVGVTDWCTHPDDLNVTRVRGTKNPDLAAIRSLKPDIVLANQEENRELDVRRLRESGVDVWVTRIRSVDEAFTSLRRMFAALSWPEPPWLSDAEAAWVQPPPFRQTRVATMIWRDPWMAVGSQTFTGDVLARLGLVNVLADSPERYPHIDPEAVTERRPHVIVLPDEPYRFTAEDGPEAFPGIPAALVDGRSLTWYGPSLVQAPALLARQIGRAAVGSAHDDGHEPS